MTITTTTHLNFRGTARQALEFYRSVFGGEIALATYGEFGLPGDAPGADRLAFYDIPGLDDASATAGETRRENGLTITDRPFFQSLRATSLDELTGYWDALAVGAEAVEPLAASAWSAGFGMLTDRFGVTWVLDVRAS